MLTSVNIPLASSLLLTKEGSVCCIWAHLGNLMNTLRAGFVFFRKPSFDLPSFCAVLVWQTLLLAWRRDKSGCLTSSWWCFLSRLSKDLSKEHWRVWQVLPCEEKYPSELPFQRLTLHANDYIQAGKKATKHQTKAAADFMSCKYLGVTHGSFCTAFSLGFSSESHTHVKVSTASWSVRLRTSPGSSLLRDITKKT